MKKKLGTSLFLCSISSSAWCVCRVPQPRMVCAEYSNSDAVVIAKLVGTTSAPKGDPDYFIYQLAVIRTLRGQAPPVFELYEGNDSGRASFDWKLNDQYLLFLTQPSPATHNKWAIDGCGNSSPMANADSALREIQNVPNSQEDGTVAGMVSTDSWTTGIGGVTVQISARNYVSKIETDANGRFSQVVPAGIYKLTAIKDGATIKPEPFSYENPDRVVINRGGCAQVQFTDSGH